MAAITATAPYAARDRDLHNRALVRGWLYFVLLVLFALVLVGGATRLTESGLSITEWQPIHGVIPPLNAAEWQEEFQRYQQIPQYTELNKGMSIEAFKSIFWWSGITSPHSPKGGPSAFEKIVFGSDVFGGEMEEFDRELERYHKMLDACGVSAEAQANIFAGTLWHILNRK